MLTVISFSLSFPFFSQLPQGIISPPLSYLVVEGIAVIILTALASWWSYNLKYSKYQKLFTDLTPKLSQVFWQLIGIKTIFAVILYFGLVFIFEKLGDLEELNWVRLMFALAFGLFIGSLVLKEKNPSDENLQQANQILGGFDLFTIPLISNTINIIFSIFNELQNAVSQDIDKKIAREESQLLGRFNEELKNDELNTIEKFIENYLQSLQRVQGKGLYQTRFNEIQSLAIQETKKRQLFWELMIECLDHDDIKAFINDPQTSYILTEITHLRNNSEINEDSN